MAQRGRLADLGWGAGLTAIALAIMATLMPFSSHFPRTLLLLSLVAAVAALAWPSAVRRVVPAALILLGLYGFVVTDYPSGWGQLYGRFMFITVSSHTLPSSPVLVVAYGLLMLGGWLAWRTTDRTSALGRLAFGRLAEPERRWHLWAFLLVPLTLMAGELIWPMCWFRGGPVGFALSIAVLAATHWLATRRPVLAARMVALGLVILGVAVAAAVVLTARPSAQVAQSAVRACLILNMTRLSGS